MNKKAASLFAVIITAIIAVACEPPSRALSHENSGNIQVGVELVGHIPKHDCDIYRITNAIDYQTVAVICQKPVQDVTSEEEHAESCGKNCTRMIRNTTVVTGASKD
jgi:hypothetical protein